MPAGPLFKNHNNIIITFAGMITQYVWHVGINKTRINKIISLDGLRVGIRLPTVLYWESPRVWQIGMIKKNPELKSTILEEDDKTKLMCLSGVKQYPMRVKCATLSWHTLISAMEDDGKQVSTED